MGQQRSAAVVVLVVAFRTGDTNETICFQYSLPFAELEAYSCVMSAFRAQGALDDTKQRFLNECRQLLNISEERHKAEARRVANDERSCTVAEM